MTDSLSVRSDVRRKRMCAVQQKRGDQLLGREVGSNEPRVERRRDERERGREEGREGEREGQ